VLLTAHKALDRLRHDRRHKRGGGKPAAADIETLVGPEPSPEFAAEVADECRRLLGRLDDPELQQVALWKMEGYTTEEVAAKLGYVPRTVERKLRLIRSIWSQERPG